MAPSEPANPAPAGLTAEPSVHRTAEIVASRLGAYTEVKEGVRVLNAELGDYSYADRLADIANARIGKFVSIASAVRVNPGDHPMERAAQHHFTYRAALYWPEEADDAAIFARRAAASVEIGHDVWLGHGAVVLSGRRIGDGAVIGAGSVLTRDAGAYEIWAGAPARLIRRRFPEPIAARLAALRWWDWEHERLRRALPDLRALSAEAFLNAHGG